MPQATVRRIQAMILSGEFARGERLPAEREFAERLAVSRASLREALSILETLGLVRVEPGKGTFVSSVDRADVPLPLWRFSSRYTLREVYHYRLLTEANAARLAAMTVSDEQIAALRQILNDHKEATRMMDLVASSQKDFELHHLIMGLSRNRIFEDLHSNYQPIFLESQRLPMARRERAWEPAMEHARVVQAIAMRDPDGAEYYMRLHIRRAADRVGIALGDVP